MPKGVFQDNRGRCECPRFATAPPAKLLHQILPNEKVGNIRGILATFATGEVRRPKFGWRIEWDSNWQYSSIIWRVAKRLNEWCHLRVSLIFYSWFKGLFVVEMELD